MFERPPETKREEEITPCPKLTAWSFSRWKAWAKCPYQVFLKYIEKRAEPEFIDKTALERGKRVHEAAEQYLKGEREDIVPELKKIAPVLTKLREGYKQGTVLVEEPWGFDKDWCEIDWFDDDVWLRAALDAVDITGTDEMGEPTCLDVYDWKTGRKDGNEVAHGNQGLLYAVCTFVRYPSAQEVTYQFHYSDQPAGKNVLKKTIRREQFLRFMETWNKRGLEMTEATSFPPKPHRMNCRFCPYSPNPDKGDGSCFYGVPWS